MSLSRRQRFDLHPHPITRRGRICRCIVTVFGVIAAAGHALAEPDPVETMGRAARDFDLQTSMPTGAPAPPPDHQWSNFHWHIPANIAALVLYGALAIGFLFVILALRGNLPSRSRRKAGQGESAVVLPNEEALDRMSETGDDAEALARRGLFAEAMHVLLLRSVAELRKGLAVTIADSLTSREILQRLTLPETGRRALADLIARVELVHFGRREAARDDYGACRASFDALIGAMRTSAAAA